MMNTTTAMSTAVVTRFGVELHGVERHAIAEAQATADANGAPCGVWQRDGWYTVCEVAPEEIVPDPELTGWVLWAVVDPLTHEDDAMWACPSCGSEMLAWQREDHACEGGR